MQYVFPPVRFARLADSGRSRLVVFRRFERFLYPYISGPGVASWGGGEFEGGQGGLCVLFFGVAFLLQSGEGFNFSVIGRGGFLIQFNSKGQREEGFLHIRREERMRLEPGGRSR